MTSPDFETSRLPEEKTLSQEKPTFPTLVPFVLRFFPVRLTHAIDRVPNADHFHTNG